MNSCCQDCANEYCKKDITSREKKVELCKDLHKRSSRRCANKQTEVQFYWDDIIGE